LKFVLILNFDTIQFDHQTLKMNEYNLFNPIVLNIFEVSSDILD